MVGTIGATSYFTKHDSKVSSVNYVENECKVPCKHLHCYMNKDGYVTYLPSEEKEINGFIKQDNYKQVFLDSDIEFANRLFENGFVLVEDNKLLIEYIESTSWGSELDGYDENGDPIYKTAGYYAFKYDPELDTFVRSLYTFRFQYK